MSVVKKLKDTSARIQANVKIKKSNIIFYVALILIIALAVAIRVVPIIRGNYLIKAFDPWIQFYNSRYLSEHTFYEYFTWRDLKSWNYTGGITRSTLYPGLIFTSTALFKILNFFGVPISLYEVCFFFPAFMGGLTILAMFFLGREVLDEKCGLFAAFFLALSPGHIQRTVAGFFDNETIGVFAILMVFLFFVKALKSGKLSHSVIGGIFLGYLTLSWGGAEFVIYIIPIVCFLLILLNKYNKNVLIAYSGVQGTGLLISALKYRYTFSDFLISVDIGGMMLFTVLLVIYHLFYQNKQYYTDFYEKFMTFFKWFLIPALVVFAIIVYSFPELIPLGFGSKFQTILNPLIRENLSFLASVAEHMPSSWSIIYYNTLIPLMLIPLGIYFCIKRYNSVDVFLIIFVLLLFYFVGSMVRIVLVFAPAAALVGSYGLVNVLKVFGSYLRQKKVGFSRKRKRLSRKKSMMGNPEIFSVFIVVGLLCTAQVTHTTDVAVTQYSYSQLQPGGTLNDWMESLNWMRTNLDGDTVVISWWDYGYWLTPLGNMTTVCDNGNYNVKVDGMVGMSFMQTNEIYSAKVLKELGAEYILVYFGFFYDGLGGDEGKWQWMLRICNDFYADYVEMGLEESNWKSNSVFSEGEYVNGTNGKYKENWFQSQLARLMLQGLPVTNAEMWANHFLYKNLINTMNTESDEGKKYVEYIPTTSTGQGYDVYTPIEYVSNVFSPAHDSPNKLVRLYKVDYTALETSFTLQTPKVYDNGYGVCHIENTGSHDITIKNSYINGEEYSFEMANSNDDNILSVGEQDTILIDTTSQGTLFSEGDTVKINVSGQSGDYTFSNTTSNFFVKQAQEEIKILREESQVVHSETTGIDNIYLTVKNTGNCGTLLNNDGFYVNSTETSFNVDDIEYLRGSRVLESGQSAYVKLSNSPISFSPIGSFHEIGATTGNNITDATLLSADIKEENYDFDLSILPYERIVSPELSTNPDGWSRNHIPIDLSNSYAYSDAGGTFIHLKVKNSGDVKTVLNNLDILDENQSKIDHSQISWAPADGSYFINVDQEKIVEINVSSGIFGVNDELGVNITGSYDGNTVASDIGYLYTINNSADIESIKRVKGFNTSTIYNTTDGSILVKNVGNQTMNLNITDPNTLLINKTIPLNLNIIQGTAQLGIQDTAILSFNVNDTALSAFEVGQMLTVEIRTEEGVFDRIEIIVAGKSS